MTRMIACVLASLMLAVLVQHAARAESTDEIVKLAEKGIGEDVLLAAVDRSDKGFSLTADDIIKLKQAHVPEKVIAAMLRKKPAAAPAGQPAPAEAADVRIEKAGETGTLNLENVDDRAWAYRFDLASHLLWITPAGEDEKKTMTPHGGVSLSVPKGAYEVRYAGEASGQVFNVPAGEKALLLFSRVETEEFEGLYVSVFERGERRAGGRLAVLRQTKKPAQTQATYERIPARAEEPAYQYEQPRATERVVERVVEPSTTVIYREPAPVYVYPSYPSYPYYYRPYCYPHSYYPYNSASFRYSNYGRRSGFSIGVGVGW
ncbi:MAG: hypothetical protein KIS92_00720 [Planctomycetota bacterium]|nr:hypothetical protein [Planctomycetota bacterium]